MKTQILLKRKTAAYKHSLISKGMIDGGGTFFQRESRSLSESLEGPLENAPDSLTKRLPDRAVDDKVDARVEHQKQVVEGNQDEKCHRVGQTVEPLTK